MAAIDKTKSLLRLDLPLGSLVKNVENPNKMSSREFDLLVDNLERTGITDAILVRPVDFKAAEKVAGTSGMDVLKGFLKAGIKFRIVGGHHRFDAATFIGFDDVPCTIIMDPEFDDEMEQFQIVRMNMIKGKLDPQKFFDLYTKMAENYSDEVLQDSFGFADEAEFKRLIEQTAKALPDVKLQKKFIEAAQEIKTIDGLSSLLNKMFTTYGNTLPFGYMVVDYGGKRSIWLRATDKTIGALDVLGDVCIDNRRTLDDIVGGVVQLLAKGGLPETMAKLIEQTPEVDVPAAFPTMPTKDNLQKAGV